MRPVDIFLTDELPIGSVLSKKNYVITDVLPASRNGFSYRATGPDGLKVNIKEFYLADLCSRRDQNVVCKSTADLKLYSELVKSFVTNAKFLTSLKSDHVSNVIEVFEQNNTAYMISTEMDGVILQDMLDLGGHNFKPGQIARMANDLFKGLVEIHAFGMLHRDISPANILITPSNGAVILPDFGTFREDKSKASKIVSSVLQSSQDYAPFELIFDDAIQKECSDLYCVGAVIYELIDGKKPARSLDRVAAVAKNDPDPFTPLTGLTTGYKRKFLKCIDMCLQLFPEDRMASASEYLMYQSGEELSELHKMKTEAMSRKPKVGKRGFLSKVTNLFSRKLA